MTVLVTGASGLLGRSVAVQLLREGHRVRTFQRRPASIAGAENVRGSLTDREAVKHAVDGVHAVIHLAAKVSFSGQAGEFHAVNVQGTHTLLEAARAAGARDVVFVSSPSVAHAGKALVGSPATAANPVSARGHYARSKAQAELLALGLSTPSFRVGAVRPHIVWGPGDTQLIERVLERARGGRLPLIDSGLALVDTTYIDNAATAITAALAQMHRLQGRAVVVSNGEPWPVGELIGRICRAGGVRPPGWKVPGVAARAGGMLIERLWQVFPQAGEPPMTRFLAEQLSTAHWFDQRQTRDILDWAPSVSLEEGFQRLAEHYGAGGYQRALRGRGWQRGQV